MHEELAAGLGKHAGPVTAARPTRALSDLPGPRGWPVLGNTPQIDVSQATHDSRRLGRGITGCSIDFRIGRPSGGDRGHRPHPRNFARSSRWISTPWHVANAVCWNSASMVSSTAEGLAWRRQRKLDDARVEHAPPPGVPRATRPGDGTPAATLGTRVGAWRTNRRPARSDALHGGRHERTRVRPRSQYAGRAGRCHSAPPGQAVPRARAADTHPDTVLALVQAARGSQVGRGHDRRCTSW